MQRPMHFVKTFIGSALAGLVMAVAIPEVEKSSFKPISIPFTIHKEEDLDELLLMARETQRKRAQAGLEIRDDYVEADLYPGYSHIQMNYVSIDLEIGSNRQPVKILVDTGSADAWVMDKDVTCTNSSCELMGTYDPLTSSTSIKLDNFPDFHIEYGDGTKSSGAYYEDSITLGGVTVDNCTFADVTETANSFGTLGIGRSTVEMTNDKVHHMTYNNFPMQMVQNGLIAKNAYSVFMNSAESASGNIIFGGYDTEKVDGELTDLEMRSYSDIATDSGPIDLPGGSLDLSLYWAIFDTGTSAMNIPWSLYDEFNSYMPKVDGKLDCNSNANATLNLGDYKFEVPLSALLQVQNGECVPLYEHHQDIYSYTIGSTIMRHMYLIFNIDDKIVSIGYAKFTDASNIVAIN